MKNGKLKYGKCNQNQSSRPLFKEEKYIKKIKKNKIKLNSSNLFANGQSGQQTN